MDRENRMCKGPVARWGHGKLQGLSDSLFNFSEEAAMKWAWCDGSREMAEGLAIRRTQKEREGVGRVFSFKEVL